MLLSLTYFDDADEGMCPATIQDSRVYGSYYSGDPPEITGVSIGKETFEPATFSASVLADLVQQVQAFETKLTEEGRP